MGDRARTGCVARTPMLAVVSLGNGISGRMVTLEVEHKDSEASAGDRLLGKSHLKCI